LGYIRAIRDALGMTTADLGARLGIARQSVTAMERSEQNGGIRLETLRRAAHAMDCTLVYALVPNDSLVATVGRQVGVALSDDVAAVAHTMRLEGELPAQLAGSDALRRQAHALSALNASLAEQLKPFHDAHLAAAGSLSPAVEGAQSAAAALTEKAIRQTQELVEQIKPIQELSQRLAHQLDALTQDEAVMDQVRQSAIDQAVMERAHAAGSGVPRGIWRTND